MPLGQSLNSVSATRRTRPATSGTAASRRNSYAERRSTPIVSKGRTLRRTGTASIRRKSCLIRTHHPCTFRPPSAGTHARAPAPTDGRAPLGRLPRTGIGALPTEAGPRHTARDIIIYELHVKGFTARANSGVSPSKRGTFAGVTEKIPYLKELGVTVVELLPIHQFDPQEAITGAT
jgi:Type II secretory pathway, pullulanase PulA and related glycosidases